MDLSSLETVKISPNSRIKIINDFFSGSTEEIENKDYSEAELSLHAGALCLYAATLLTKIYDKTPVQIDGEFNEIQLESNAREVALQSAIRSNPKFAHYSEEQVKEAAHNMLLRDIRNSFAHGNFEIGYNIHTKKLYFVLQPRRKDVMVSEPIIISKNALKKSLAKTLSNTASKYKRFTDLQIRSTVRTNISTPLQSLMLPSQMLQFADYYLEKPQRGVGRLSVDPKRYMLIQYALLITQATYEQDDYYNIFGKDSNIFNKIAVVRNANAHDGIFFGSLAKRITYTDRSKTLDETLQKSTSSLLIANTLKESILQLTKEGQNPSAIKELKDRLATEFNFLFTEEGDPSELFS